MKHSSRTNRMKRRQSRSSDRSVSLNLVSLMDIFTILVFFLLVNASTAEVLPTPKDVTLPSSVSEKSPLKNLVIAVNATDISLQGSFVISVEEAIANNKATIKPLFDALRLKAATTKDITDTQGVTIMGDKEIPYLLLKKIMLTCAGAEYTNISFAVNQKFESTDS